MSGEKRMNRKKRIKMTFKPGGMLKKMMLAPAIVGMLFFCACDNSSGDGSTGGNISDPNATSVSGKVTEGWSKAAVCLDVSRDGSCLDETEYVSKTDENGDFHLGEIPNETLHDYDIVVEATGLTTTAGTGASAGLAVREGLKMTAPGFIAFYDDANPLYMSPLLTIANEAAKGLTLQFGYAYKEILSALGLNRSLNIAAIDYKELLDADVSFEVIMLLNEYALNNVAYEDLFNDDTDYRSYSSNSDVDYEAYLSEVKIEVTDLMGATPEELASLTTIVELSGARSQRNAYYNDTIPPEPQFSEGEYQEKLDAADMGNSIRGIVIGASTLVPKVGIFLNIFLEMAWPEEVPDVLGLLYRDANLLIQHHLNQFRYNEVVTSLKTLHGTLVDAKKATEPDLQREKYLKAWGDSGYILDNIVDDEQYAFKLVPMAVLALNARMVMNKERLANYDFFYPSGVPSKDSIIENLVLEYKKYRDKFFNLGEKSLYKKYLTFRHGDIEQRTWTEESGFMGEGPTMANGLVSEPMSGFRIHYFSYNFPTKDFTNSVKNVVVRLDAQNRLDLAKMLSSLFIMARLLPEGSLKQNDVLQNTELLGPKSYYIPDDLKTIEVGPISNVCLAFYGEDHNYNPVVCEPPERSKVCFETPITSLDAHRTNNREAYARSYVQLDLKNQTEGVKSVGQIMTNSNWGDVVEENIPPEGLSLIGFDNLTFSHRWVIETPMGQAQVQQSDNGLVRAFNAHYVRKDPKTQKDIHLQKRQEASSGGRTASYTVVGTSDFKITCVSATKGPPYPSHGEFPDTLYYMFLTFSYFPDGDHKAP